MNATTFVILSARRLSPSLMTDLFQANGGKHEAKTRGETREKGATRKKKNAPPLAHASLLPPFTWKMKKNSRPVLQAMTFNYRKKVSNLVLSGNVTCFLSRDVVQRIEFYYIYNNDHAPFNG